MSEEDPVARPAHCMAGAKEGRKEGRRNPRPRQLTANAIGAGLQVAVGTLHQVAEQGTKFLKRQRAVLVVIGLCKENVCLLQRPEDGGMHR